MRSIWRTCQGQSLVEVLVALGILAVILPVLVGALVTSRYARPVNTQRLQATGLMVEAQEATRSFREAGWNAFGVNGTYHPAISGSIWTLAAGSETISGFTRQIVVSNANRNSADATVVTSGGINDNSTKTVTASASWSNPYSSSSSALGYLTRWRNNTTWVQSGTSFDTFTAETLMINCSGGGNCIDGSGGNGGCQGGSNNAGLQLCEGATSGNQESSTFDAGSNVAFNYLDFTTAAVPSDTTIKFQLAINTDNATWTYFGPDGTGGTFYSAPGAVALAHINGRFIRYKVFMTSTSGNTTPLLTKVVVNYSP